jgi:hypothetical protein
MPQLRAPFPYFGGKRRVAPIVWARLGNVPNYVEPFAGSLATLLARPAEFPPRVETVNDVDCYLSNFWRALKADPDAVASYADYPVNEADLHARHLWLVTQARENVERVKTDPDFYDAKVAGWWVWGQCLWIGSGWCAEPTWSGRANAGRRDRGIHTATHQQRPDLSGQSSRGLHTRNGDTSQQKRRPQLTNDQGVIVLAQPSPGGPPQKRMIGPGNGQGTGVHSQRAGTPGWKKRPAASRDGHSNGVHRWQGGGQGGGSGVHSPTLTKQQVPDMSGSRGATGRGIHAVGKSDALYAYLAQLADRLRRVRVCCGDWTRVLTPSVTTYIGVTGVFLDPPYSHTERSICYSEDHDISADVRAWALEHGADPKFRIALCGYEGEHTMPDSWECVPWKAHGGYSRSARGRANRDRERIWFSPHCLKAEPPLFAEAAS